MYFVYIIYFSDCNEVLAYTYDEDMCRKLYGLLCNYLSPELINWRAFSLSAILDKFIPVNYYHGMERNHIEEKH